MSLLRIGDLIPSERAIGKLIEAAFRLHVIPGRLYRLKDLEQENARLKRAVADLVRDKLTLKEAAEGNR